MQNILNFVHLLNLSHIFSLKVKKPYIIVHMNLLYIQADSLIMDAKFHTKMKSKNKYILEIFDNVMKSYLINRQPWLKW